MDVSPNPLLLPSYKRRCIQTNNRTIQLAWTFYVQLSIQPPMRKGAHGLKKICSNEGVKGGAAYLPPMGTCFRWILVPCYIQIPCMIINDPTVFDVFTFASSARLHNMALSFSLSFFFSFFSSSIIPRHSHPLSSYVCNLSSLGQFVSYPLWFSPHMGCISHTVFLFMYETGPLWVRNQKWSREHERQSGKMHPRRKRLYLMIIPFHFAS